MGDVLQKKETPVLTSSDLVFLEEVETIVKSNLADASFGVQCLADALSLSRQHLTRKLCALTGQSPVLLIRQLRLEQAAILLRVRNNSVKEVCYKVGFKSPSSFTKAFREAFGIIPSSYAKNIVG